MNLDERDVITTIKKAAKAVHDAEKFMIPVLAVKASKAAQAYPHDASLVTASNVLRKMAEKQNLISRSELNKLYETLYSPNTRLAEVFASELDRSELPTPKLFQRSEFEQQELSSDYARVADPMLANALEAALDGSKQAKLYSAAVGKKAEKACLAGLMGVGVTPGKIDVFAGQKDIIICQATYMTPKGESNVLVPVEIQNDLALTPNLFLTRAGFAEISEDALEDHIISTAGKSFKVDGEKLLQVISEFKNGTKEVVSEVDLAVMKMKSATQTPAYSPDGILYQQIDEPIADIEMPQVEQSAEHIQLSARLNSPKGMAIHVFGATAVSAGINMLARKLADFGFKHSQVSVASVDPDTINYAVAVDRNAGFTVPVKVQNGLVLPPTVAFASGNVAAFSQAGLSSLASGNEIDKKALAVASPMYEMKPAELMKQVRAGLVEGNMLKVEDAIDVLGETAPHLQKEAIALMLESMNPSILKKVASENKGCKQIMKTSASKHELCGHLNRPLHEVYQDENGDCQPMYRKGMDGMYEGGTFLAHKIFQ